METAKLSKALLRRLPLYLDYLKGLPEEESNISATSIAAALSMGEVQVRKDLAKIAGEGRCRTGRSRDRLIRNIESFMNDSFHTGSVLIGTDSMNLDLLKRCNFVASGISVVACFARKPSQKQTPCGRPIYSVNRLENFCRYYNISQGIIAAPAEDAQAFCDGLIACGIQSIWNFSPVQLTVPSGIRLQCGKIVDGSL